jgi:hypothetical protein
MQHSWGWYPEISILDVGVYILSAPMSVMQRRRVLQLMAAGTTLLVAGCSGDDTVNGNTTNSSPSDPEAESGGSDNDSEGSTSTDGTTESPTGDGSGDGDGGGESDAPTLGNIDVAFENNYRFSVSVPQMGMPITGAFNGGNFYSVVSTEGETVTTYVIDGATYVVGDGYCTQVPGSGVGTGGVDPDSLADADTIEQDFTSSEAASLVPSGTATIDGEQMYVYELAAEGTTATYQIGVESRRLRRVETQGTVFDYTDWGTVDPITAPC